MWFRRVSSLWVTGTIADRDYFVTVKVWRALDSHLKWTSKPEWIDSNLKLDLIDRPQSDSKAS